MFNIVAVLLTKTLLVGFVLRLNIVTCYTVSPLAPGVAVGGEAARYLQVTSYLCIPPPDSEFRQWLFAKQPGHVTSPCDLRARFHADKLRRRHHSCRIPNRRQRHFSNGWFECGGGLVGAAAAVAGGTLVAVEWRRWAGPAAMSSGWASASPPKCLRRTRRAGVREAEIMRRLVRDK